MMLPSCFPSSLTHVEEAGLAIEISSAKRIIGGMWFANDFVGVNESRESLQKLIDVVYGGED